MSPGKRKAPSSPGSRPPALAAPGSPRFLACPICRKSFVARIVQEHAWSCTGAPPSNKDTGDDGKSDDGQFVSCPVCSRSFPQHAIESHAWGCVPSVRKQRLMEVGEKRGDDSPVRQPAGDAVQRLMEAGKRAGKAERDFKIVPPAWPVERIEGVLPAEKADSLLARLLHVSRDWASRPWYNVNGTPGMTHNRSCMYRIPSARDSSNSSRTTATTTTTTSSVDLGQPRPPQASDEAPRRAGSGRPAGPGSVTESGGSGECAEAKERKGKGGIDDVLQSSEDESFDYGLPEAGKIGGAGADSPRRATAAGRAEGAEKRSAPDSEAEGSTGKTWIDDDQGAEVAPEELLEVVPLVVEVVRRRQRRRVEEGLGGHEGLGWNPNFCICNVYDDHRNHLGPHSDTLSSIGPEAIVVGISLGAKRVFMVQEKLPWGVKAPAGSGVEGKKKYLDMPHNSAVVMWGGCQERYKHAVPNMTKGVGIHPMAGTKRISITLRERKEALPSFLLPVPECRCGAPATLNSRVLKDGRVEYLFHCDRARGACGFTLFKGPRR